MQIQEIKLLNFRNYDKASISFDPYLNIIYGENGSGKTNLVEAIYVLALSKSFKQVQEKTLIRKGTNVAKISGSVKNIVTNNYQVIFTEQGKKVKIDKQKITKLSDYISKINVVLFSPNDLRMINDTPSVRRKYLNIAISQINIKYLKELSHYNKLLKIRNAYLKKLYLDGNKLTSYLDVITEKLVDAGLFLYEERKKYIDNLNQDISLIYKEITDISGLEIKYKSDYSTLKKSEILKIYKKNMVKDIQFGKTTFGVHHDDFSFNLDSVDLKDYGSMGQQKNAIIAWKFSEINLFKKEKNVNPILILDDLFSELDKNKIAKILTYVSKDVQTFITTTEIDSIVSLIGDKHFKKIYVHDGILKEEL